MILGGFGAGGTAALLGLLFPQLAGLVSLGWFETQGWSMSRDAKNKHILYG